MEEMTLGDIFDEIAERLAAARTKALMGEREEALGLFQGASLEYTRFQDVLQGYPGHLALKHAFEITLGALCDERGNAVERLQPARALKPRRKARRAA